MKENKDFKNFIAATSQLGEDFLLTQGAGGNTSFKSGEYLFIKASGLKLKDAGRKNIFVKVNFKKIVENINLKKSNPMDNTWDLSKKLKPSIETTMHSIMPQKYVFHLHCLNTISLVVQKNFKEELNKKFKNLNFSVIDYAMPGEPLTKTILDNFERFSPDVLFLSNHGLVVGSNNLHDALMKIDYISKVINKNESKKINFKSNQLIKYSSNSLYRPIKSNEANIIAYSNEFIKFATSGVLFPDQALFLGPKIFVVKNKNDFKEMQIKFNLNKPLPILIVPNQGILVPRNISNESEELVLALSIIISKLPKKAKLNYLNKYQVNEIVNSSAEKYRLLINNSK